MAVEIERKFLVVGNAWRERAVSRQRLTQGYLANTSLSSVRVRRGGEQAWVSVKSMTRQLQRLEFEYPIPVADADIMLEQMCERPLLDKVRHLVPVGRHVWEVDEFAAENAGLIVAEIELDAVDEPFDLPDWAGAEVTHEERYYNFRLGSRPYSAWTALERAGAGSRA